MTRQVLGLVQTTTIALQVKHGRGRQVQDIPIEDYNRVLLVRKPRIGMAFWLTGTVQLDQHAGVLPSQRVRLPDQLINPSTRITDLPVGRRK